MTDDLNLILRLGNCGVFFCLFFCTSVSTPKKKKAVAFRGRSRSFKSTTVVNRMEVFMPTGAFYPLSQRVKCPTETRQF